MTTMLAKDQGLPVRIIVSGYMKNKDVGKWGWWYCVKGGMVGYFVTKRPKSGCSLQGLGPYEEDIFNVNSYIETKEQFAELIMPC